MPSSSVSTISRNCAPFASLRECWPVSSLPPQRRSRGTASFRRGTLSRIHRVLQKGGRASGSSDRQLLGARCPTLSVVPVEGDRFIGEAEPPFKRFFHIAPGPKHITSNKRWCDRMTKVTKKQKPIQVSEDMQVINRNDGGIEVG